MGAIGQEIAVALIVGVAALWIGLRAFRRAKKGGSACESCPSKGSGAKACEGCAAMKGGAKGASKGRCPGCG
ncbi:MAG TPA: hypothetical protein VMV83_10185 [Rectinemataceae bacterium]|nr:hypothetical protein [Rectinemataceae bacterium]